MTANEWWMFGFIVVLSVAYFASQRATYKSGVWDGAYNQWLPHVQKILDEHHSPGSVKACQRECAESRRQP